MRQLVLALTCLACTSDASNERMRSSPVHENQDVPQVSDDGKSRPSQQFAMLLRALSPAGAFNPSMASSLASRPAMAPSRAGVSDIDMAHHVMWKGAKKFYRRRPKKKSKKHFATTFNNFKEAQERPSWTVVGKVDKVPTEGEIEEGPGLLGSKQKIWYPKGKDMAIANKKWYLVDATQLRLGRMASEIAKILLGKNKAEWTPGAQMGDYVVVVNAEKVIVTGNKYNDKLYRRHSGRPGGMKIETFKNLQARIPERIVEKAVAGMLPKNSYGRELFRHLKVYKGPDHPHEAQEPEPITFGGLTSTPDLRKLLRQQIELDDKWVELMDRQPHLQKG